MLLVMGLDDIKISVLADWDKQEGYLYVARNPLYTHVLKVGCIRYLMQQMRPDWDKLEGYIYLARNPLYPHILNIGCTNEQSPHIPIRKLFGNAAGVPAKFELLFYLWTSDAKALENDIHRLLDKFDYRFDKTEVRKKKDFFTCSPEKAIELIGVIYDEYRELLARYPTMGYQEISVRLALAEKESDLRYQVRLANQFCDNLNVSDDAVAPWISEKVAEYGHKHALKLSRLMIAWLKYLATNPKDW